MFPKYFIWVNSSAFSTFVKQSAEVLGSKSVFGGHKGELPPLGLTGLALRPTAGWLAGSVISCVWCWGLQMASPLVLRYRRSCVNVNVGWPFVSLTGLLSSDFRLLFEVHPSIRSAGVDGAPGRRSARRPSGCRWCGPERNRQKSLPSWSWRSSGGDGLKQDHPVTHPVCQPRAEELGRGEVRRAGLWRQVCVGTSARG